MHANTGWHPDEIDRLTIPAYEDLAESWRRWPSPRSLLAALAASHGVKFEDEDDAVWDDMTLTAADLAEMHRGQA